MSSNASNNLTTNGPGSRKDSTNILGTSLGAGAGELALNFFDKLKNKKNSSSTQSFNSSSNSSSAASTEQTAANLLSNLAISFHKNLTSHGNNASGANDGSVTASTKKQLVIIDDDTYDDDEQKMEQMNLSTAPITSSSSITSNTYLKPHKISASKSEYDIILSDNKKEIKQSITSMDINKIPTYEDDDIVTTSSKSSLLVPPVASSSSSSSTTSTPSNSLPSSSSFYKFTSSVFDDLLKKSDLVDTYTAEADAFKKKFLTKTKSIELSFENIKKKVIQQQHQHSSLQSNTNTPLSNAANKSILSDLSISEDNLHVKETDSLVKDSHTPRKESNASLIENDTSVKLADANHQTEVKPNGVELNKLVTSVQTSLPSNNQTDDNYLKEKNDNSKTNNKIEAIDKSKVIVKSSSAYFIHDLYKQRSRLLIPIGLSILVAAVLLPKQLVYFLLTYSMGFINGIFLAAGLVYLVLKLDLLKYVFKPETLNSFLGKEVFACVKNIDQSNEASEEKCEEKLRNLLIQTAVVKENKNFDGIYKGWMNELREVYEPENYFLNKTRSVFVNLEGTMLRLQTTTSRIPKRAVCGETIEKVSFNEQRIYDLTDCEVFILPHELCRKRYWSKKYPLCLKGAKLQNYTKQSEAHVSNFMRSSFSINNSLNLASKNEVSLSSETNGTEQSGLNANSSHGNLREMLDPDTLVLFARTDREKEEWFRLFKKSSKKHLLDCTQFNSIKATSGGKSSLSNKSSLLPKMESIGNDLTFSYDTTNDRIIYKLINDQKKKMKSGSVSESMSTSASNSDINSANGNTSQTDEHEVTSSTNISNTNKCDLSTQTSNSLLYDSSLTFINTFLIRIFADFFKRADHIQQIQNKIQNKLNKINLPYFMEPLQITDVSLGSTIPLIKEVSEPWYDEKGLWVHLEIDYNGGIQMSLATKLNLMKLKTTSNNSNATSSGITSTSSLSFKNSSDCSDEQSLSFNTTTGSSLSLSPPSFSSDTQNPASLNPSPANNKSRKPSSNKKQSAITHSDEEDSPESSGDEYEHKGFNNEEENKLIETANPSKKILSIVNKIAASNYFQKATENKYIKMAMENVSNCQLLLNVEFKKITGTIALNIPSHPSDRIWWGFAKKPDEMQLIARPVVGENAISYSAISDLIAEKLKQEFQKVLVFPNMDDFYIPILNSEVNYKDW